MSLLIELYNTLHIIVKYVWESLIDVTLVWKLINNI